MDIFINVYTMIRGLEQDKNTIQNLVEMETMVAEFGIPAPMLKTLDKVIRQQENAQLLGSMSDCESDCESSEQHREPFKSLKTQILKDPKLGISSAARNCIVEYAEFGQYAETASEEFSHTDAINDLKKCAANFAKYVDVYEELCMLDRELDTDVNELHALCTAFEDKLITITNAQDRELEEDRSMSALNECIESAKSYLTEIKLITSKLDSCCPPPSSIEAGSAIRQAVQVTSAQFCSLELSARFGGQFLTEQTLEERFDSAAKAAQESRGRWLEEKNRGTVVLNPISAREADPLRVSFVLEGGREAFDSFDKEDFARLVAEVVGVDITIESVTYGSIHVEARAPGGLANAQRFRAHAAGLCSRLPLRSITISDYSIATGPMKLNERYNRNYRPDGTYWRGALPADPFDRGQKQGFVYPCPEGWDRYALKLDEFDAYAGWPVAYHGTASHNTPRILEHGLLANPLCYCGPGESRAYFSPCIDYSAHPRFAKPHLLTRGPQAGRWVQMVLMCRVNPAAIERRAETLLRDNRKASIRIHSVIPNSDMEWLVAPDRNVDDRRYVSWFGKIVCYGILTRTASDPARLPQSAWWSDVHRNLIWKPGSM